MARQFSFGAQVPKVELLNPAADAAGRTSRYISLKNAMKVSIEVHLTQGNAATVLLSVLQATNVAGAGSKAIAAVPIFSNLDTSISDAETARTAGATYTTDAATKNKTVRFEFVPEAALDMANGFVCIAISTGASNAANITQAEARILTQIQSASPPNTYVN